MSQAIAVPKVPRAGRWVSRAGVVLLFALFALPALLAPRNFPSDDSLFYLQVARHIAAGHGSTFNTVTPTNGYHPLWMGPCVAAAWLSGGEPMALLRLAFGVQILLASGGLLLFRALARRLEVRSWPLGIPVLGAFFLTGMYGSEAHLNGLLVLGTLFLLAGFRRRSGPRDHVWLGVLLGLTLLARLDDVFLVATILAGAAIAVRGTAPTRVAAMARIVTAMGLVVAPYLLWNLTQFGHLVPISGAIKSTLPRVEADFRNLGVLGFVTWCLALAAAGSVILGYGSAARRLVLGSAAAGVLIHGLYVALFTNHNTHWSWYYVPGTILGILIACVVADAVRTRWGFARRRAVAIALIALLTVPGLARGWARFANSRASSHNQFVFRILPPARAPRWEVQFTERMDRMLPARAPVLVYDYPGHFAYYSSLRIVPADGLVGDFRYDAELRSRGLSGYLAAHGIRHYVGPNLAPLDSCRLETIFAPVQAVDVGALSLCPENVVATSAAVVRGVSEPDVALFRIGDVIGPRGTPPRPMLKHGMLW